MRTKLELKLCNILYQMRRRCYNKKSKWYKGYGKRGIKVCTDWLNGNKSFINWCLNNGYKDGLYLDRINNDEDYEPYNCRFVDAIGNTRNRRCVKIICDGKSIADIARENKISRFALYSRLKNSWSLDEAISIPVSRFNTRIRKGSNEPKS